MTKPNEPEGQKLRDLIAEVAADLSNENPFWTAKILADALIARGIGIVPAQPIADAGGVTEADRELHMWLTGYPLDDGDSETVRRIIAHRLQSVAAATAAKDAEIDQYEKELSHAEYCIEHYKGRGERLREALTYFANRPTVAEVIEGKHDPMPDTVEARIEEMGRRKREHDEAILQARAALSEAREAGALADDSAPS